MPSLRVCVCVCVWTAATNPIPLHSTPLKAQIRFAFFSPDISTEAMMTGIEMSEIPDIVSIAKNLQRYKKHNWQIPNQMAFVRS